MERFVNDHQDTNNGICKELLRDHISQIVSSLRDLRADFASGRKMAEAANFSNSTLNHLMHKKTYYKKTGLSDKTVERLRRIGTSLPSPSAAMTEKLNQLRTSLDRYLECKRLGMYGHKVR